MAKINIVKPTGSDNLSLLSAFKTDNFTYAIFDSEKVGSMGLPIIYIAKLTEKLEKINDDNEWQNVKNCLKGIINGTNFEYVKVPETINADEVYYTPLTLPQASFDLIKNRYVVKEESGAENPSTLELTPEVPKEEVPEVINSVPQEAPATEVPTPTFEPAPTEVAQPELTNPIVNEAVPQVPPVTPTEPVIPSVNAESNANVTVTPNVSAPVNNPIPVVETSKPELEPKEEVPVVSEKPIDVNAFIQDKETFLKACENMFDALVSKYQKQFEDIEAREQALREKEALIQNKLNDANEHLANAEAREQVANIAHDNAQKVMDLSNMMPSNPNTNQ